MNDDLYELVEQLRSEISEIKSLADQILTSEPVPDLEDESMTMPEVISFFGKCRRTIVRWAEDGVLPARRIRRGKRLVWLFSRKDVMRFFEDDCY